MQEDLLQFIWNHGLFNQNELKTSSGENIVIEQRGSLNKLSGPDFSDSRIRIDSTLWVGSVEIHIRSSEWNQHKHQNDKAYNNVILHVVFENDLENVRNQLGDIMPVLELKGRISKGVFKNYEQLKTSKKKIPCADHFNEFPRLHFRAWLDRLLASRLERKCSDIELLHKENKGDWLETFYQLIAGYFGQNHNKLAFQELTRKVPMKILSKHIDNANQIDAMLFGVATLIDHRLKEDYTTMLEREFEFLKNKYDLKSISQLWKFGGVRPDAFPTRRLALLAGIIPHLQELHTSLLQFKWQEGFKSANRQLKTNPFWETHYSFTSESKKRRVNRLSESFRNLLLINAIAPYIYFYGMKTGSQKHLDEALNMLSSAKPERNQYVKEWEQLGFNAESTAQSQALIELTTQYCKHKNCVICNVGKSLILNK